MPTLLQRDERFADALRLFDNGEFFACHDVLEEIWSETLDGNRQFLQGLIHAAVALFHFGEGNLGGARKMHDSALRYLAPYGPTHEGVDLEQFVQDFNFCFEPLLGAVSGYPAGAALDPARIPRLKK